MEEPRLRGEAADVTARDASRLKQFTSRGYDRGRNVVWQAAWVASLNLVFMKWWCPSAWRASMLRAFGATVGQRVLIRHRVRVLWPWKLDIADDVWIGEGVWLLNLEPISIAEDVCISQEALVCTGSHHHRAPDFAFDNAPIRIERGAWIGARAIVLRGSVVPANTLVPAGGVFPARQ